MCEGKEKYCNFSPLSPRGATGVSLSICLCLLNLSLKDGEKWAFERLKKSTCNASPPPSPRARSNEDSSLNLKLRAGSSTVFFSTHNATKSRHKETLESCRRCWGCCCCCCCCLLPYFGCTIGESKYTRRHFLLTKRSSTFLHLWLHPSSRIH